MIICYLGGIGSGKSISAVRQIIDSGQFVFTNFKLKNYKGKYHRLKYEDIIEKNSNNSKKQADNYSVNWDFWDKARDKHKSFSIFIDEIHNVISSRSSMSIHNKLMSRWISQIRKITSDSEVNHFYMISQKIRKIDIDFRELAHIFIECNKIKKNDKTYIIQTFYEGIERYELGIKSTRKWFIADPYFKFFDSYEMIKFGDSQEYV